MTIIYQWRGDFDNAALNRLHAEGFEHPYLDIDWHTQVHQHSLGWVCAIQDGELVGFVNVAWDGDCHAFILDTLVAGHARHSGIGTTLVATAAEHAKEAGCEWLHVDFENHLTGFYFQACAFTPVHADLIALADQHVDGATLPLTARGEPLSRGDLRTVMRHGQREAMLTRMPSSKMVHAPHQPWSQPFFGP